MLSAKALFALGAAVIAGTFVALMLKSRGPTEAEIAENDRLAEFGREQEKKAVADHCGDSIPKAVEAARDFLVARYGDGGPTGIRDLAIHRCVADGWSDEVLRCLDRVTTDNEMQRCIGRLDEIQRRALEAEMRAFESRPPPAIDAGVDALDNPDDIDFDRDPFAVDDAAVVDAAVPQGGGDLPTECMVYEAQIAKLMTCDKLPQAARDAMKQGMDAMKQGWGNISSFPPEALKAMDDACKQAADAVKQSMSATGC